MLEQKIRIISAGAGSGKTYRLTEELIRLIQDSDNGILPEGIVATTFTRKAAAELVERLRQSLFKEQKSREAEKLAAGLIGTVNSISGILLKQIAFEAGISPQLEVVGEEDQQVIFNKSLAELVDDNKVSELEDICDRLENPDWKEQLKGIIDAARSNNCLEVDFSKFSKKSISTIMKFIPEKSTVSAAELDENLSDAIITAINDIKNNTSDKTKGTKQYFEFLEGMEVRIKSGQHLTWKEWVDLATKKPTKSSESLTDDVRNAASVHAAHPRFHDDINNYIQTLFSFASDLLSHYQEYKKERGLIDFVDQESQLLSALESQDVRDRLSESLDILLVDEFQDTSPIQLALFLKLSEIVKKSIWVGDPKQSIYGFRGADPSLMAAVTKAFPVKKSDIQTSSYRSRPDLVKFVNGLFVPSFAEFLPKEQVALNPNRTDPSGASTAIRLWPLNASNKKDRLNEIANGVVALVKEAPVICDKETSVERKATAGDIAVLCRTNNDCRDIASLIAELGVRVAIGRPGLIVTPEGKLVLACLRYYLNPYDTLANAEIQVLSSPEPNPEIWLADRLEWVSSGKKSHEWGNNHNILSSLKELAKRAIDFSPSEALDEIIETTDLRRVIMGWGERERRLGNLENIRDMVRIYEDSCRRQMSAATVSGFLLWLSDLSTAKKDNQAEGHGIESVSLLTCHASKGLEWPIVIVATLDTHIRERIWEVTVNDERDSVPLTDPLSERWIRLWPWPYGKKSKDTGLNENLEGSDVMKRALVSAEAEELRLLYVTLTRARDYLVLCLNNKGVPWLDLVLSKAKLALPPLDKDKIVECEWGENGEKIKIMVQLPTQNVTLPTTSVSGVWLKERIGKTYYPPAKLNPSVMELPDGIHFTIGKPIITGKLLSINAKTAYERIGNAIHGFMAVDFGGNKPNNDRIAMLQGLLFRHGVIGTVNAVEIVSNCDGFYRFVESLRPTKVFTEWPIQMKIGNQLLVGTADMLLETPAGWIVIDHKTFPGPQAQWPQEAADYAGQLRAYSDAVQQATGKSVAALYLHFVVGGGVVQVML